MQVDSFMELPKKKRPPEDIWDDPEELDRWFDAVFGRDGQGGQTGINLIVNDVEG